MQKSCFMVRVVLKVIASNQLVYSFGKWLRYLYAGCVLVILALCIYFPTANAEVLINEEVIRYVTDAHVKKAKEFVVDSISVENCNNDVIEFDDWAVKKYGDPKSDKARFEDLAVHPINTNSFANVLLYVREMNSQDNKEKKPALIYREIANKHCSVLVDYADALELVENRNKIEKFSQGIDLLLKAVHQQFYLATDTLFYVMIMSEEEYEPARSLYRKNYVINNGEPLPPLNILSRIQEEWLENRYPKLAEYIKLIWQ